jgi:tRNA-Thr(GGU) m(6)t(6)A37 methyltransferase TsaA
MLSAVKELPEQPNLTLHTIGYVRTGKSVKFEALHQPDESKEEQSVLEIIPHEEYRIALQDLSGFSRIWLIWWFHRNDTWRPLVLPPRGPSQRRGVFATRSPHRPNPIGMTPVKLLGVDGCNLLLGPCDLVDGTPIFDIKPYIPAYDAFPEEKSGWLDDVDTWMAQPARYRMRYDSLAELQAQWLQDEWQIDFMARAEELLERDPSPHRTRRIRKRGAEIHEMGCGAWRIRFCIDQNEVIVREIAPGYPLQTLIGEYGAEVPDRDAQLAFLSQWPFSADFPSRLKM